MKKSPVAVVKERFQSKQELVAAVQKLATSDLWLDRVNGTKGLARVSNAKLVKLHDVLTDAKQRFGSREKLIAAILEISKRSKDKGYSEKLGEYPLPRLLDLHRSAERQNKRAAAKASGKTAAPVKTEKKAAKAPAKTTAKKTAKKA